MDVASNRQRSREVFDGIAQHLPIRRSHRARSVTYRQLIRMDDGHLELQSASVTPQVGVSGVVDVEATVLNGATAIIETDPNSCVNSANTCDLGAPDLNLGSYCYQITADPEWAEAETFQQCIDASITGLPTKSHSWDFPAPDTAGTYSMTIALEFPGSGEVKTTTFSVAVDSDRPGPGCSSDSDCPSGKVCRGGQCVSPGGNGGGGPWLPCILDPNRSCGEFESMAIGIFVFMLILVVVGVVL